MRRKGKPRLRTLHRVIGVGILLTLILVYIISIWSGRVSSELEASSTQLNDSPSDYFTPAPTPQKVTTVQTGSKSYTTSNGVLFELSNRAFFEEFTGNPTRPLPWRPTELWDISIHSRDVETWRQMLPMEAHEGTNCEPYPATHRVREYADTVFQCNGQLLTAIHGSAYAVAYFSPAVTTRFSAEEPTTIRFDVSTARSSSRDWIDIWLSPYEDNLIYPLQPWLPDLTGEPRNAIHIRMDGSWNSRWTGELITNFQSQPLPGTDSAWQGYETFIIPSVTKLETYELQASSNRIRFGLPDYDFWWIDTELQTPLTWNEGIVQFGHHSNDPEGACDQNEPVCEPNTWRWDNIAVDPADYFTLVPADARYVDATTENRVYFNQVAPSGAFLRFAAIGENIAVSFDEGLSWVSAELQAQSNLADEKFKTYWMPIPPNTNNVTFQGEGWWGGPWHIRDISIWSR